MLIDERTKIAALLKHHPDALETIVTLSPDFKKLRNPILRALMAKRTTIAMASKVGGCRPEDFYDALAPLGFETDHAAPIATPHDPTPVPAPKPEYLQHLPSERLVRFDVRPILGDGHDPLKAIQQKIKSLQIGEALVIINNFEPVPLIKLLEKQGYQTYVHYLDAETIEAYFYKKESNDSPSDTDNNPQGPTRLETGDWESLLKRYANKLVKIDVRHLEMPMPMMTILENLETLPPVNALYVHHKRVPVFLLNELKDRDYDYRVKEVQDGEVYLLIFKN